MATLELPYEKVYDLLHKCCTSISPDVLYLMKRAAAKETNPEAKTFLETMLKNVELAGQMDKPVCQSPGFPSVWIRWGEAMQPNLTNLMGNITQSVIEATKAGYIRPSIVHPLTRHNPGDSSGRAFRITNCAMRRICLTAKSSSARRAAVLSSRTLPRF